MNRSFFRLPIVALLILAANGCSYRGNFRDSESTFTAKQGAGLQSTWQLKRSYMAEEKRNRAAAGECTCFTCLETAVLAAHPELNADSSVARRELTPKPTSADSNYELQEVVSYEDSQLPNRLAESDSKSIRLSVETSSRKDPTDVRVSTVKTRPTPAPDRSIADRKLQPSKSMESRKPRHDARQETRIHHRSVLSVEDPNELVKFDVIEKPARDRLHQAMRQPNRDPATESRHENEDLAELVRMSATNIQKSEQVVEKLDNSVQELEDLKRLVVEQSTVSEAADMQESLTTMRSQISQVQQELAQMRTTLNKIPEQAEPAPNVMIVVANPEQALAKPAPKVAENSQPVETPLEVVKRDGDIEYEREITKEFVPEPQARLLTSDTSPSPVVLRARADRSSVADALPSTAAITQRQQQTYEAELDMSAVQFQPLPRMQQDHANLASQPAISLVDNKESEATTNADTQVVESMIDQSQILQDQVETGSNPSLVTSEGVEELADESSLETLSAIPTAESTKDIQNKKAELVETSTDELEQSASVAEQLSTAGNLPEREMGLESFESHQNQMNGDNRDATPVIQAKTMVSPDGVNIARLPSHTRSDNLNTPQAKIVQFPNVPKLRVTIDDRSDPLPPIVSISTPDTSSGSPFFQKVSSKKQITIPSPQPPAGQPQLRWEFPGQYAPIRSSEVPRTKIIDGSQTLEPIQRVTGRNHRANPPQQPSTIER